MSLFKTPPSGYDEGSDYMDHSNGNKDDVSAAQAQAQAAVLLVSQVLQIRQIFPITASHLRRSPSSSLFFTTCFKSLVTYPEYERDNGLVPVPEDYDPLK